jgi:hypothetical protein
MAKKITTTARRKTRTGKAGKTKAGKSELKKENRRFASPNPENNPVKGLKTRASKAGKKSPLKGLKTRAKKSDIGKKPSKKRRIAAVGSGVDSHYGSTNTYEIQQNKGRKSKKPIKHKDQSKVRSPKQISDNRKAKREKGQVYTKSLRQGDGGDIRTIRQQVKDQQKIDKTLSRHSRMKRHRSPTGRVVQGVQSMIGWLNKGKKKKK